MVGAFAKVCRSVVIGSSICNDGSSGEDLFHKKRFVVNPPEDARAAHNYFQE